MHMDAQRVWGSVQGTAAGATPKVFNLTGMAAESVGGLESEVSQHVTSAEERVALAQSGAAPVEGVAVGAPVIGSSSAVVAGVLV